MNKDYLLDGGDEGFFVFVERSGGGFPPAEVAFNLTPYQYDWVPATPCERRGWWVGPAVPTHVLLRGEPVRRVDHYRLMDGVPPTDEFPAALSPKGYSERVYGDEVLEVLDERVRALYEAVYVTDPPREEVVDARDMLVLDGVPEPDDGLVWQARLPFELQNRREYLHLFPGEFAHDFRQVVHDEVERMPQVAHCFMPGIHRNGDHLEVTIRVPFDPPLTTTRVPTGRRKPQTLPRTVDVRIGVSVPSRVGGSNRVEARAEWDRLLAGAIDEVWEVTVAACGHCEGSGFHVKTRDHDLDHEVVS